MSLSCLWLKVSARDISLSVTWLRDMARYSGIHTMGKRKRNDAQRESRETKLRTVSDEIAFHIMQCGVQDTTSPAPVANNINEFIGQASRNKSLLCEVLGRLTKDQVMSCVKALSSNHCTETRVMALSKLLFQNEYATISKYESKCRASHALLTGAVEYALCNGYSSDDGYVNWSPLQEDMLKAIRGHDDADM